MFGKIRYYDVYRSLSLVTRANPILGLLRYFFSINIIVSNETHFGPDTILRYDLKKKTLFLKQYSFFTISHIDLYYAPIEAESSKVFPCII